MTITFAYKNCIQFARYIYPRFDFWNPTINDICLQKPDRFWPPKKGHFLLDHFPISPLCFQPKEGDVRTMTDEGFLKMLQDEDNPRKRILTWEKEVQRERILNHEGLTDRTLFYCELEDLSRISVKTSDGRYHVLHFFSRKNKGQLKREGYNSKSIAESFNSLEKLHVLIRKIVSIENLSDQILNLRTSAVLIRAGHGNCYLLNYDTTRVRVHADGINWRPTNCKTLFLRRGEMTVLASEEKEPLYKICLSIKANLHLVFYTREIVSCT